MTESEVIRLIKRTVRSELAQTFLGSTSDTNDSYVCSLSRFSTDSVQGNIRLIRPSGFTSRPFPGTTTVIHPINGDPSHLLSLGDFDEGNRPSIGEGESAMYGSSGQLAYTDGTDYIIGDYNETTGVIIPNSRAQFHFDGSFELGILKSISSNAAGEVFLGSTSADNPLVLGDILQTFCDQIITILNTALNAIGTGPIGITTTPGNPAPTAPGVTTAMTSAVSQLTSLKAQYVDSPTTNFLSITTFTERGV